LVRIGEKFRLESPKVNKAPGGRLPEGAATLVEAMTHDLGYQLETGNNPDRTGLQRDSENECNLTKSTRRASIVTSNPKVKVKDSSSNNDNKLRRLNESVVTVNLTRIESKRQNKQQVCTDKMIQKNKECWAARTQQ